MPKHRVSTPSNSSSSRIAMLAEPDVYRHPAFLSYRVAIKQNEILGKFWHLCMIDALKKD